MFVAATSMQVESEEQLAEFSRVYPEAIMKSGENWFARYDYVIIEVGDWIVWFDGEEYRPGVYTDEQYAKEIEMVDTTQDRALTDAEVFAAMCKYRIQYRFITRSALPVELTREYVEAYDGVTPSVLEPIENWDAGDAVRRAVTRVLAQQPEI